MKQMKSKLTGESVLAVMEVMAVLDSLICRLKSCFSCRPRWLNTRSNRTTPSSCFWKMARGNRHHSQPNFLDAYLCILVNWGEHYIHLDWGHIVYLPPWFSHCVALQTPQRPKCFGFFFARLWPQNFKLNVFNLDKLNALCCCRNTKHRKKNFLLPIYFQSILVIGA